MQLLEMESRLQKLEKSLRSDQKENSEPIFQEPSIHDITMFASPVAALGKTLEDRLSIVGTPTSSKTGKGRLFQLKNNLG